MEHCTKESSASETRRGESEGEYLIASHSANTRNCFYVKVKTIDEQENLMK